MRKGFLFLASALVAALTASACGQAVPRSSFGTEVETTDGSPTEPGFGGDASAKGQDGNGECGDSRTTITRTPLILEFLVDQSGSMASDNKWDAARDALLAVFEDMKTTADPSTYVGLYLFDDYTKVDPGPMTDASHYDDLVTTIDQPEPGGGGTPTEAAMKLAYPVIEKFKVPTAPGQPAITDIKRALILVSDGVPNGGTAEQTRCEELADEKFNAVAPKGPILTFSVGIGKFPGDSNYDPKFMSRISQRGGTAAAGCDPNATDETQVCHFQVTPGGDVAATKQALIDAINQIRLLTATCEYGFTMTKDTDLGKVEVIITANDGSLVPVPKSTEEGWSFDDEFQPTKIILHGEACKTSNGLIQGRVDVDFGCKGAN